MESSNGEWERWFRQEEPETAELPSEWESKCNELQRLLLVRGCACLRVNLTMNYINQLCTICMADVLCIYMIYKFYICAWVLA
jgi:hypothetical protein